MNVREIFHGSDGEATKLLYAELEKRGPIGTIALNLFRAQKASTRAKVYRRKFKGAAYDKKNWSLRNLCDALIKAEALPMNARELSAESIDHWRDWAEGNRKIRTCFVSDPPMKEPVALVWGWKADPAAEYHRSVLYVELPTGQVSFHSATPLTNHRYHGEWDGQHVSAERIIRYVDHVLTGNPPMPFHGIPAPAPDRIEQTSLL